MKENKTEEKPKVTLALALLRYQWWSPVFMINLNTFLRSQELYILMKMKLILQLQLGKASFTYNDYQRVWYYN